MSGSKIDIIKVMIVDDHQLVIEGIESLLTPLTNIKVVCTARDGAEALLLLEKYSPDLVLLDVNMPKMDGLEACLHISKNFPGIKILALSTYDEGEMITRMIKNGASGYVLKNITSAELSSAIIEVMKGNRVLDAKLTTNMINNLQKKDIEGSSPRLTRREKEILELIADELTTQEIAGKLFLSSNTVLSHRKNLFLKFGVNNSIGLIKKAIELDLV